MKNKLTLTIITLSILSSCVTLSGCVGRKFFLEPKEISVISSENTPKHLYKLKAPYIGDISASSKILNSLPFPDGFKIKTKELQTTTEPYSITIYAEFTGEYLNEVELEKLGVLYLALMDNAGSINFALEDCVYTIDRTAITDKKLYGFDEYDGSFESFEKLYSTIMK